MPAMRYLAILDDPVISTGLDAIRAELGIVEAFDAVASHEAEAAARRGPALPPGVDPARAWVDRRDLELVAIDPPGSRDLDQAYTAERTADGYRVWYAIADVAAFVHPGGALEAASLDRGVTLYAPDRRASLHPVAINEHAASLLPGLDRPSCLWRIDIDHTGALVDAHLERATVRVRQAMSYRDAQTEIDGDSTRDSLALLRTIGHLRQALERTRGAVSLTLPSQEIVATDGGHRLVYDETLPVEGWNARISLLTGIAAAQIMVDAGIGLLRTLPPPDDDTVSELRRTASGLGVDWPADEPYAERVRRLDPDIGAEVALAVRAARLLRGAGYVAFTSTDEIPDQRLHSAIASTYAHVTAPLRRVCDRYANEVLVALCAGTTPPGWAVDTLTELPSIMGKARNRESSLDRTMVDYIESVVLADALGEDFDATVVNHRRNGDDIRAVIQLSNPAVISTLTPPPPLGTTLKVRLVEVDPARRHVRFEATNA
jgi:exoribonuclease R